MDRQFDCKKRRFTHDARSLRTSRVHPRLFTVFVIKMTGQCTYILQPPLRSKRRTIFVGTYRITPRVQVAWLQTWLRSSLYRIIGFHLSRFDITRKLSAKFQYKNCMNKIDNKFDGKKWTNKSLQLRSTAGMRTLKVTLYPPRVDLLFSRLLSPYHRNLECKGCFRQGVWWWVLSDRVTFYMRLVPKYRVPYSKFEHV